MVWFDMPGSPIHKKTTGPEQEGINDRNVDQETVDPELFEVENITTGVIRVWHQGSATATVSLGPDERMISCTWVAAAVFSPFFGLRTNFAPEPGTPVLVLTDKKSDEGYILGVLSASTGSKLQRQDSGTDKTTHDFLSGKEYEGRDQYQRGDATMHSDRAPGEFDLESGYGVGLQLLQNLCSLRATELSAVECHLMDDMVRIISDNFQHISSFGDYEILNDGGRPTVKWKGNSKFHETLGKEDPIGDVGDADGDPFEDEAKRRFEYYLGFLGNIFHAFVTDPAASMGDFAAGRFRAHVNEDGSFLMQSVGDIIFEKTRVIPVPAEQKTADDPEGEKLFEMDFSPHPSLQTWIPENPDKPFYESYKLRDYARWMNNWFSLAQYHRSKKDYKVPSESEAPEPEADNKDVERPNSGYQQAHQRYLKAYSTIRMFRDGSILCLDGYGSSVHMSGGDVSVSASKHLNIEAAGDLSLTAGRDIYAKAYRHMDLAALDGGITIRAKKWFRGLCEKGTLLLESLVRQDEGDNFNKGGVLLRSKDSDVHVATGRNFFAHAGRHVLLRAAGSVSIMMRAFLAKTFSGTRLSVDNNRFAFDGEGHFENMVHAQQFTVQSPRFVPLGFSGAGSTDNKLASLVYDASDSDIPPASEIVEGMASIADPALDEMENDELKENEVFFKHHGDFDSDSEPPRSTTQNILFEDPGFVSAMTPLDEESYVEFDADELKVEDSPESGEIAPGTGARQKTYKGRNSHLHEKSGNKEEENRGEDMEPEKWTFKRME